MSLELKRVSRTFAGKAGVKNISLTIMKQKKVLLQDSLQENISNLVREILIVAIRPILI